MSVTGMAGDSHERASAYAPAAVHFIGLGRFESTRSHSYRTGESL